MSISVKAEINAMLLRVRGKRYSEFHCPRSNAGAPKPLGLESLGRGGR